MYRYISLACLVCVFAYSCTKTNSGSTQPPPPPPPPGGSGNGSGISITSVSPLTPYSGDLITVTGTGFDPDITKDTVTLGYADSAGTSFTKFYYQYGTIKKISATSTQIQFVTDSFYRIPVGLQQTLAVRVSAPLKSGFTRNILSFKKNLTFGVTAIDPSPYGGCLAIYAGDSVFLSGEGLYPPLTVTINGVATKIIADANSTTSARGLLPLGYFGTLRQVQCINDKLYTVKVVNGDGRTFSRTKYFFEGPNSALNNPFAIGLSYYLSQTPKALINLTGYALRNDYSIQLSSTDNANNTRYTENLSIPVPMGFPNQASFYIDLTQFPKPTTSLGTDVGFIIRIVNATDSATLAFGTAFTIFP